MPVGEKLFIVQGEPTKIGEWNIDTGYPCICAGRWESSATVCQWHEFDIAWLERMWRIVECDPHLAIKEVSCIADGTKKTEDEFSHYTVADLQRLIERRRAEMGLDPVTGESRLDSSIPATLNKLPTPSEVKDDKSKKP